MYICEYLLSKTRNAHVLHCLLNIYWCVKNTRDRRRYLNFYAGLRGSWSSLLKQITKIL